MINCAHPTHLARALENEGSWLDRNRGLRANASRKSLAEWNESAELEVGDPAELGAHYAGPSCTADFPRASDTRHRSAVNGPSEVSNRFHGISAAVQPAGSSAV